MHSLRKLTFVSKYNWTKFRHSQVIELFRSFSSIKKHPPGYWKNFQHHRDFFDALFKHLNLKSWEDWYQVSHKDIEEYGGSGLLSGYYHNSSVFALTTIYPEKKWDVLKFVHIPPGTWKELSNQRTFFEQLAQSLNIQHWEDWYHVTKEKILEKGGIGIQ